MAMQPEQEYPEPANEAVDTPATDYSDDVGGSPSMDYPDDIGGDYGELEPGESLGGDPAADGEYFEEPATYADDPPTESYPDDEPPTESFPEGPAASYGENTASYGDDDNASSGGAVFANAGNAAPPQRKQSVGQKIGTGFKKTGKWIKGGAIRFGHKVKNEDWGGDIKRGAGSTGKAVKDSFVGMGRDIKSLGNKKDRGKLWDRTKAAWSKQWRLLKKNFSRGLSNFKDKDKRKEVFAGMKRSAGSTFKSAGQQIKGYGKEVAASSKTNIERAEGVPSEGKREFRPPNKNSAASSPPSIADDPYDEPALDAAPADEILQEEATDYDATVSGAEGETKYTALYNYDAGNEDELSLSKGEGITAVPADEIGWLFATNNEGVTGLIPANYVSEA